VGQRSSPTESLVRWWRCFLRREQGTPVARGDAQRGAKRGCQMGKARRLCRNETRMTEGICSIATAGTRGAKGVTRRHRTSQFEFTEGRAWRGIVAYVRALGTSQSGSTDGRRTVNQGGEPVTITPRWHTVGAMKEKLVVAVDGSAQSLKGL
jgi:hypothetical protein